MVGRAAFSLPRDLAAQAASYSLTGRSSCPRLRRSCRLLLRRTDGATVFGRGDASDLPENSIEVRQLAESSLVRHLGDRQPRVGQQALRSIDPQNVKVLAKRDAELPPKQATEMEPAQPGFAGHLGERDRLAN